MPHSSSGNASGTGGETLPCPLDSSQQQQQHAQASLIPKTHSLIFGPLDEMDDGNGGNSQDSGELGRLTSELCRFLGPCSSLEYRLRSDVEAALQQHRSSGQQIDDVQWIATCLGQKGYRVAIRTALGGGEGFECLKNLRHVFLTVTASSGKEGSGPRSPTIAHSSRPETFVVDLSFKEQFAIAKPTERYTAVLDCLPAVYVAPERAVAQLVQFMSQEIALAFKSTGTVLPPWRHASSMLSKWLPRKSMDEQIVHGRMGNGSIAGVLSQQGSGHKQARLLGRHSIEVQHPTARMGIMSLAANSPATAAAAALGVPGADGPVMMVAPPSAGLYAPLAGPAHAQQHNKDEAAWRVAVDGLSSSTAQLAGHYSSRPTQPSPRPGGLPPGLIKAGMGKVSPVACEPLQTVYGGFVPTCP